MKMAGMKMAGKGMKAGRKGPGAKRKAGAGRGAGTMAGAAWASDLPAQVPGTGFFDRHPRFEETSTVAADIARLNFRHHLIIEQNRTLLEGRRVLDIASHDGRFALAALDAGAQHVTGIEARDEPVEKAQETFAHYGAEASRYRFMIGDIYDMLPQLEVGSIDTAMVLGFLYHTPRQYELFAHLARLQVRDLIIDSQVLPGVAEPLVKLRWEGTRKEGMIWDAAARDRVLSGIPSASALELYMQEFGWQTRRVVPAVAIPRTANVYRTGRRVTIVGTRD